jgi:hypothetical protein
VAKRGRVLTGFSLEGHLMRSGFGEGIAAYLCQSVEELGLIAP